MPLKGPEEALLPVEGLLLVESLHIGDMVIYINKDGQQKTHILASESGMGKSRSQLLKGGADVPRGEEMPLGAE
jgi:hypothetical protein